MPKAEGPSNATSVARPDNSAAATSAPTIGELEAKYSLYCEAMRRLLKEGRSLEAIQRTLCWSRLAQLHTCLPSRYKSPDYLCVVLRRDLA